MFQVSETVFDTINHEYDEKEKKKKNAKKIAKFGNDEKDSDVILHGYVKKLVSKKKSVWPADCICLSKSTTFVQRVLKFLKSKTRSLTLLANIKEIPGQAVDNFEYYLG